MTTKDMRSQVIAVLNDRARTTFLECRVVLTEGIQTLPDTVRLDILQQVRSFDAFTPDNDPYGEHDFGAFDCAGKRIFWKFDYYDQALRYGSPDPTDTDLTCRVLTIFLAEEY
jgi:hypothetical protein